MTFFDLMKFIFRVKDREIVIPSEPLDSVLGLFQKPLGTFRTRKS